jgi:cytochrome c oxidase subunit 2
VLYFAVKYRRRSETEQPASIHSDVRLELLWTVIPLVLSMAMFGWGASLYCTISRPPADALEISVVGKQWMWKFQHPQGPREINQLHIPVGRAVKLTMASEDVIHSVYVPVFRVKMHVVP